MSVEEIALCFPCEGESLVGVLHRPTTAYQRGILVVVGGPQYRIGSHRQFTLMARELAAANVPTLRFDCRGMGDSGGTFPGFENIIPDIHAAMNAFVSNTPGLSEVVIWGLCDAASAALFYGYRDPRVTGMILLNPWIRTESVQARAYIKHYYPGRLAKLDFWRKVRRGDFRWVDTVRSVFAVAKIALGSSSAGGGGNEASELSLDEQSSLPLPARMADGLRRFEGRVLVILSEKDLTAREFEETVTRSAAWRKLLAQKRVSSLRLGHADHTFSRREWCDRVAAWTRDWVTSW